MGYFCKFFLVFYIPSLSFASNPLKDDSKDTPYLLSKQDTSQRIIVKNREGLVLLKDHPLSPDQLIELFAIDHALGAFFNESRFMTVQHYNALSQNPCETAQQIAELLAKTVIAKLRFSSLSVAFPYLECLISKDDASGHLGYQLIEQMIERKEVHVNDAKELNDIYPTISSIIFKAFGVAPTPYNFAGSTRSEEELIMFRPITPDQPKFAIRTDSPSYPLSSDRSSHERSSAASNSSSYVDQDSNSTEPMEGEIEDSDGNVFEDNDSSSPEYL